MLGVSSQVLWGTRQGDIKVVQIFNFRRKRKIYKWHYFHTYFVIYFYFPLQIPMSIPLSDYAEILFENGETSRKTTALRPWCKKFESDVYYEGKLENSIWNAICTKSKCLYNSIINLENDEVLWLSFFPSITIILNNLENGISCTLTNNNIKRNNHFWLISFNIKII